MPLFDRKDKSRYATFSRRALIISGGMGAVFAALAGRLYQLQILEGEEFMTRAEDNRVNQRLLAPLRGRIIDRFGIELATNRRNYRVLLVPEQATEGVNAALSALGRLVLISDRQRERILHDVATNKRFVPVTVMENLDLGRFRAHQSASALSAGHPARCRRDTRLSFRRCDVACAGLCRGRFGR